jgi:hypothetical protein
MVRLVTQYNNMRGSNPFRIGEGWDGANGPWLLHIVNEDYKQRSIAPLVVRYGGKIDIPEWLEGDHLTKFRLELIYE